MRKIDALAIILNTHKVAYNVEKREILYCWGKDSLHIYKENKLTPGDYCEVSLNGYDLSKEGWEITIEECFCISEFRFPANYKELTPKEAAVLLGDFSSGVAAEFSDDGDGWIKGTLIGVQAEGQFFIDGFHRSSKGYVAWAMCRVQVKD